MNRALLLLLVATPAWADKTVAATPRLTMAAPDDAKSMGHLDPTNAGMEASTGYELAKDSGTLVVERGVLDGGCALFLDGVARRLAEDQRADGGKTVDLKVSRSGDVLSAIGKGKDEGRWMANAVLATCRGPESLIVTTTNDQSASAAAIARTASIPQRAIATLAPAGTPPDSERVAAGSRYAMDVPAPAYKLATTDAIFTLYPVPGVAQIGVGFESIKGECPRWLDLLVPDYEKRKAHPDGKLEIDLVERIGDVVVASAHQHGTKGSQAGNWYVNIEAHTCVNGVAFSVAAVSFDGGTTKRALPVEAGKRVKAIVVHAAQSLR